VAGVCQDIGLAAWLNTQDPTNRQQASMGTATAAMVLNGLGESLRLLYSVPHFFANKPVEDLLGSGITAERRKCRLFGANPGLVVCLRSHRAMTLPEGSERSVIVRTHASQQRAQLSMQRQVSKDQTSWAQMCRHLAQRRVACEADARAAI